MAVATTSGMAGPLPRGWLCSCALILFAHVKGDRVGRRITINTNSFGAIDAQVFGKGGTTVVALHGMYPAAVVVAEWDRVAATLGEHPGYRVVLPNLHSNKRTAPLSLSSDEETEQLCTELLTSVSPHTPVVLIGKSWGGGVAARCASTLPSRVRRLVLVAPALANETTARQLTMPTLLLWAKDDAIVPYSRSQARAVGADGVTPVF